MRRSRPCARDLYVAKTQTSQGSSSSSWSIQNSRCASAQSCASSSESALPCVSCSWQYPPVREKNSIKDQRGWLVLNPARPPAIVASGPMMQPFPLRSSPVRPMTSHRNRKFSHDHQSDDGNAGDINQNCTGFTPTGRRRESCGAPATRPPPSPTARTSGKAAARFG